MTFLIHLSLLRLSGRWIIAQWVESVWNRSVHSIVIDKNLFPIVSERVSKPLSAPGSASEASSAEQANEWAVRVGEQMEERMAQHSTRRFHTHAIHCALKRLGVVNGLRPQLPNLHDWSNILSLSVLDKNNGNKKYKKNALKMLWWKLRRWKRFPPVKKFSHFDTFSVNWPDTHYTKTQRHKATRTQGRKATRTQRHKVTKTQRQKLIEMEWNFIWLTRE